MRATPSSSVPSKMSTAMRKRGNQKAFQGNRDASKSSTRGSNIHTVQVDLTTIRSSSGFLQDRADVSTEKTTKLQDGSNRSVVNLLTFYNSKQSHASSKQQEVGPFRTPHLDRTNSKSARQLSKAKPTQGHSKPRQETLIQSFDAGVPLKPQKATKYNLKTASIFSDPPERMNQTNEVGYESQEDRKNVPASMQNPASIRSNQTRSRISRTSNTKSALSLGKTCSKLNVSKPHGAIEKSKLLLQIAKETSSDNLANATDTLLSLRKSSNQVKTTSDASLLSFVSKSPRPTGTHTRKPGVFPTSHRNNQDGSFSARRPQANVSHFKKSSKSPIGKRLAAGAVKKRVTNSSNVSPIKSSAKTMEDRQGPELPLQDVQSLQSELKLAVQERDFLLSSNAVKRVNLKNVQQEVTVLSQGNKAVNKEICRMVEENKSLVETHLNQKNVIQNFCNENEEDCNLIREFESSNKQIREQAAVEQTKITEARQLIKMLKQELIVAQKERDSIRQKVLVQRKQLDKSSSQLNQQQRDKNNALRNINQEMSQAVVTSVNAFSMMSPAPIGSQTPNQRKVGESISAFKSVNSSRAFHSRQVNRSVNQTSSSKQGSRKAGTRKQSQPHNKTSTPTNAIKNAKISISELKSRQENLSREPQWVTQDGHGPETEPVVENELVFEDLGEEKVLDDIQQREQLLTFDFSRSNQTGTQVI